MANSSKGLIPVNRALTSREVVLIHWLLNHGSVDPEPFKSQIGDITVVSKCNCGCPTIYFANKDKPIPRKGELLIADYLAIVEGQEVGVMLFQNEGYLSSLEVYSCGGSDKPFGLPEIESIYSYEELERRRKSLE